MANSTQITVLNSAAATATVSTLDGFRDGVGTASMVVTNVTAALLAATVIGTTAISGTAVISGNVTAALSGTAIVSGNVAIDQSAVGTSNFVVAGRTRTVSVTVASSTTTAYAPNNSIGGTLTFSGVFGTTGAGVLQTVDINWQSIQTASLVFVPFNANPSNSTFTDHVAAAIGAADVFAVRDPVSLTSPVSNLGTHTNYSGQGLGIAMAPGTSVVYGVLVATATTNAINSTGSIQITVKTLSDS